MLVDYAAEAFRDELGLTPSFGDEEEEYASFFQPLPTDSG
jgi:hypothetical protein